MIKRDFYITEGIVLKRIKYKESSIIFNVLTQKWGRIAFISKGALKSKELRDTANTETGNHIEISFQNKTENSIQIPKRIVLKNDFMGIKNDYDKYLKSAEILKDVCRLLPEHEKNEKIFFNLIKTFKAIEEYDSSSIESIVIIFRITLLAHLGYLPSFNRCSICNRGSDYYAYSKESGPVCRDCMRLEKESIILPKETRLFFEDVKDNLDDILAIKSEELNSLQTVLSVIISQI